MLGDSGGVALDKIVKRNSPVVMDDPWPSFSPATSKTWNSFQRSGLATCWAHWWMTAEQLQEQETVTADDLKDARKKYRDREDALWAGDE